MRSVFIVGNTGSGKSTLARRLAAARDLPHIDLDQFAWTETVGERRELPVSLAALDERIGGRAVVVEGMYADLIDARITDGDELIWLDLPVDDCIEHCRKRPFEPHKWPSAAEQDAFLPELLAFLRTYGEREDELGRAAHQRLFGAHGGPKVRVTSSFQARELRV